MRKVFLTLCLLFSLSSIAQNTTIAAGEKLTFTASYNMSGIMTDLAEVKMQN